MALKVGHLATAADRTEEFWRSAFSAKGELLTERTGQLWNAVIAEHQLGRLGAGRCIAIIDGNFDSSYLPAESVHPSSRIPLREPADTKPPHGTIVALLALAVAPHAQVLLIDAVTREGRPREDLVAAAIEHAVAQGADVINLSLAQSTGATLRDGEQLHASMTESSDPNPDEFVRQIDRWIEDSEPYVVPRCPEQCLVCDALLRVPAATLVVAAAGNSGAAACPACFSRVVGVGFHRTTESIVGNTFVLTPAPSEASPHASNALLYEVTVEQPPGFDGTSYASPLVSGLGALIQRPADVAEIAHLSFVVAPLAAYARRFLEADPPTGTERAATAVQRGLTRLMAEIPKSHRHWDISSSVVPCPLCATVLVELYNSLAVNAARSRIPEALSVALSAAAVSPISPASSGNLAAVWEDLASGQSGAQRVASLEAAEQAYMVAGLMASTAEVEAFFFERRRVVQALLEKVKRPSTG